MSYRLTTSWLICLIAGGYASVIQASSNYVAVVHPKSSISTISSEDLKKIYLGKIRDFPSGQPITPVDQAQDSAIRAKFNDLVLGKTAKQLQTYWSVQIFSGKGTPPPSVGSDTEVKAWIAKNPSAIGYIAVESVDSTVKVIFRIH